MDCRHPLLHPFFHRLALSVLMLGCGAALLRATPGDESSAKKIFTAADLTAEQRASITVPSANRPLHLRSGETLVYKIGWSWFEVGEATLTLNHAQHEGLPTWKMELTAQTNSFADAFYKVRNRTRSWFDRSVSQVIHYEASQHEGDREKEIVVDFDPAASTVQYTNKVNDDRRPPIPIIDGTWDPMSITYYVRTLPLKVGDEFIIPTTNGKSLYLTRVVVKERKRKKFKSGKREAFLLEPDIKDLGGVFRKSDDATVRFWFSADDNQLPLRMESSVAVGKFWAELVRVEYTPPASGEDAKAEDFARN